MAEPKGFSHGVVAGPGRTLHIAGETGHRKDLSLDDDFVAQFGQACRNVAMVVEAAGGEVGDLVSLTIFVTDVGAYRDRLLEIGREYQAVFGKHFPAMALIGISELVDPAAMVEMMGVAVVPD
jgi:enamine deaminase RidA (YjgF/YER057c/UK114 family)